jgi:hypothetical protein
MFLNPTGSPACSTALTSPSYPTASWTNHPSPPRPVPAASAAGTSTNPRARTALTAVLALAVAPDGFTAGDLAGKVQSLTGQNQDEFTVRQGAYDLRKLRA